MSLNDPNLLTKAQPQPLSAHSRATGAGLAEFDVGLRGYMLGIYNRMAGGLALTGIVDLRGGCDRPLCADRGDTAGLARDACAVRDGASFGLPHS